VKHPKLRESIDTTRTNAIEAICASTPVCATVAHLEVVQLRLERLDGAVGRFEVLVEPVALRDKLRTRCQHFLSHSFQHNNHVHDVPTDGSGPPRP
jgi:hypothetical protein